MSHILQVQSLTRTHTSGSRSLTVLDGVSFGVNSGETFSITGPSGSGKTTLLGLCAGLDIPTSGDVVLCGASLNRLTSDERARLRNEKVGFIFQDFQLLPTLTALENVLLPLEILGLRKIRDRGMELLDQVGLADRAKHYPTQLSGGEQQRVAIARAFANDPEILFADEPTGNLDAETGDTVEKLLFDLNAQRHTTLVIVTHDLELAARTQKVLRLKGGRILELEANKI